MKKHLLIATLLLFSNYSNAQKNNNYETLWKIVEGFELQNLPKSAMEIVEDIYQKATKSNNGPQIIKALIYKSKFALTLEEDAQLSIINNFKTEISKAEIPTKNVLESLLANLYWQYFQQNRYKFYNRTETNSKVDENDFRTWDLQTLFQEINVNFQNSLHNGLESQLTDLKQYDEILNTQEDSKTFRPTLFDFLSYNALDFYKPSENAITKPAYKFEIDNAAYLSDFNVFSKLQFEKKDSLSLQLNALLIYQKLIAFHSQNNQKSALIATDIDRINFVKENAVFQDIDSLQLAALHNLKQLVDTNENATLVDFEIANIYNNQANTFVAGSNQINQFKRTKALVICNNAIDLYPNSLGAKKCLQLKQQIESETLAITTEENIPINTYSKVLVNYKNIDTLYFTVYNISKNEQHKLKNLYNEQSKIGFINQLSIVHSFSQVLITENDFQNHTTEIAIPPLKNGQYLIVATQKNKLIPGKLFASTIIQATNIAISEIKISNENIYQLIDRNTGEPINNTRVNFKNYNIGKYNKPIDENFITDNKGQFKYQTSVSHNNIEISVETASEKAYFDNYYLYNYREKDDEDKVEIEPFLFTDRSIYRPGQTVFFKGIFVENKKENTKVFAFEKVKATIYNANNEEITNLNLTTNEYGSVNGEFILSTNGLLGQYAIKLEVAGWRSKFFYFSVEEYKRPKFETSFNPITETYKINDSVTVNGTAMAYAGSSISNAKVVYKVNRKVQYPRWFYSKRPEFTSSDSQEISHGETLTDDEGNYKIVFKAIPDNKVKKENLPIFTYEISAAITDVNGETRSCTTNIKVGYHSLLAEINMNNRIDKNEDKNIIHIETKNLNNQFVSAKGTLKIYKLQAPENVLIKRSWSAPDYKIYDKETFKNRFPHEAFSEEDKIENWDKSALIYQENFDTANAQQIELPSLKTWSSGSYISELTSTDKFGKEITDKQIFTIFSDKDSQVSDKQLFSIAIDKKQYKPSENVILTIGSASNSLFVTIDVAKNNNIISTEIIHLNNNKKQLKIPVNQKDLGGFSIHYSFANYNAFDSGSISVSVPYPTKELTIETLSFRDKLEPGQEETWSFKLKGAIGEKVAAELLASMYDASLDQFKPHNWQFNPINYPTNFSYNQRKALQSFSTQHFSISNSYQNYYNYPQQQFDQLNWFGFSFKNNYYVNRQYLNSIKIPITAKSSYDRSKKEGFIFGTVYDSNNQPLPGVNVLIKGSTTGVITDFDGNFTIEATKDATLVFSYIGFETSTLKLSKDNIYTIILTENNSSLDEVVVVGYGTAKKRDRNIEVEEDVAFALVGKVAGVAGATSEIKIRGMASISGNEKMLIIIDGLPFNGNIENLDQSNIISVEVLKDAEALALYGAKAANGVVIITTKNGQQKLEKDLAQVKTRTNFNETAFFYPSLTTDENGHVSFNFTAPETLTQWKLQLIGHTKEMASATKTYTAITQKELMVMPNPPRFLREGDEIEFSNKISNLTSNNLNGVAQLILINAITGKEINTELGNISTTKNFVVDAKGNTNVNWKLKIPENIQAVQYKIVAKSGDFSDGEQNVLPVLTNRTLVTETLPMWVRSNQTKTFTLEKLKSQTSTTLKNHKLTLEITSKPAWYAVQSLPYLIEYPYECAEQTFARYYANTLASHIANSNPRIQEVFNQWKTSDALISNLEKNEELKSIILQETPWLRDAQSETEQKNRIALLFDLNTMKNQQEIAIKKLQQMQFNNGGFPWFKGSNYPNRYVTQHIVSSFGHLTHLNVAIENASAEEMIEKAVLFLDDEILDDYTKLLKEATKLKEAAKTPELGLKAEADYLAKNNVNHMQIQYLYARSFYLNIAISKNVQTAIDYYTKQTATYWTSFNLYSKGLIALIQHRNTNQKVAVAILNSLKETSITSDELGMYWKENTPSWYWYQAPIETQALMVEVFSEIENNIKTIDELKIWLLKNKQTNSWKTTKETTEAVYALLLQGSDWLTVNETVEVTVGNKKIDPSKLENVKVEAGTGYFKTSWNGAEITPEMSQVTISKKDAGIAWGSLYWQYFEDLDKITSAETPLKLSKKLFLKSNSDTGKKLTEISEESPLQLGDLITVRIELKVDRQMEFVHLKDMRASGLEPVNVLSSYKWQDGLGYYESTKDASTNFFFEYLPKGIYVFEYDLRVNNAGNFSNGISTIQSMYAPEFSSHSEGVRILVE